MPPGAGAASPSAAPEARIVRQMRGRRGLPFQTRESEQPEPAPTTKHTTAPPTIWTVSSSTPPAIRITATAPHSTPVLRRSTLIKRRRRLMVTCWAGKGWAGKSCAGNPCTGTSGSGGIAVMVVSSPVVGLHDRGGPSRATPPPPFPPATAVASGRPAVALACARQTRHGVLLFGGGRIWLVTQLVTGGGREHGRASFWPLPVGAAGP